MQSVLLHTCGEMDWAQGSGGFQRNWIFPSWVTELFSLIAGFWWGLGGKGRGVGVTAGSAGVGEWGKQKKITPWMALILLIDKQSQWQEWAIVEQTAQAVYAVHHYAWNGAFSISCPVSRSISWAQSRLCCPWPSWAGRGCCFFCCCFVCFYPVLWWKTLEAQESKQDHVHPLNKVCGLMRFYRVKKALKVQLRHWEGISGSEGQSSQPTPWRNLEQWSCLVPLLYFHFLPDLLFMSHMAGGVG